MGLGRNFGIIDALVDVCDDIRDYGMMTYGGMDFSGGDANGFAFEALDCDDDLQLPVAMVFSSIRVVYISVITLRRHISCHGHSVLILGRPVLCSSRSAMLTFRVTEFFGLEL